MNKKLSFWYNLILLLIYGAVANAATLEATLDRTRTIEGESLTLSIEASGDNQDSPDLSPLHKDFEVLGQSQSTRMTILNGATETTREWRITLIPKRIGTLTVPAISVGSIASDPIQLQVLPANQAGTIGEARPVILEVETDTNTPYVQSQVVYTVRILSKVTLRQAELTEPKADDAIIERLGTDTNYKTNRDGQTYQVIERRYAVFPQRSGALTIAAPVLTASIPEPGGRRLLLQDPFFGVPFGDPFGDLGGALARQTQVRGRDITLEVKPQPIQTATAWLPAKDIKLAETWSPNPPQFKIGEPVTRTITITAQGLSVAQLPDFEPPLPSGIKSYPDKAQGENQVSGNNVVATKTLKQALVPTQAGTLTLPEVQLPWWNTQTNRLQVAHLPARIIEIPPLPTAIPQTIITNNAASIYETPNLPPPQLNSINTHNQISPTSINQVMNDNYWIWITSLLGAAWLFTIGLWWKERQRNKPPIHSHSSATVTLNTARAAVKRSCLANDARATKTALLAWSKARWPSQPIMGLDTLAIRLHSPTATARLQQLDRYLYANTTTPSTTTWDGTAAWRVLSPLLHPETRSRVENTLVPDLYPVLHS